MSCINYDLVDLTCGEVSEGYFELPIDKYSEFTPIMISDSNPTSSTRNIDYQSLEPIQLDGYVETYHNECEVARIVGVFHNELERILWKLEEAGIRTFQVKDSFSVDHQHNINDRKYNHYMSYKYVILEDDLYKHAFVDGVWREGAIEEAADHAKKIINRRINKIFNSYVRS